MSSSPSLTEEELLAGAVPDIDVGIRAVLEETDFRLSEHIADETSYELLPAAIASTTESSLPDDFERAQANLRALLEKGNKALNDMIILAGSSDNPRAYEVLTNLINSLSQINKDQIELHLKKTEIEAKRQKIEGTNSGSPQNVTNNLIVASPTEMIRMMRQSQIIVDDDE